MIDAQTRIEIAKISKKLDGIPALLREDRKKILSYAAIPLADAAQRNAPTGTKIHRTYSGGKVVGTYHPGNLKKSAKILTKLKKSPDVFVGPEVLRGGSGTFGKGKRVNAYYAHMVEYGTVHSSARPFMRPALSSAGGQVMKRMENGFRLLVKKYVTNNSVK